MRTRLLTSLAVVFALIATAFVSATPAHAAYGAQIPVTVQVSAYSQNVGMVTGWVQFDDGRTNFRYELTFCRESSFQAPTLEVHVNNVRYRTIYHSGGGGNTVCRFANGVAYTEEYGSPVSSVQFIVIGSSFNQNVYRTHRSSNGSSYGKVINPYF